MTARQKKRGGTVLVTQEKPIVSVKLRLVHCAQKYQ